MTVPLFMAGFLGFGLVTILLNILTESPGQANLGTLFFCVCLWWLFMTALYTAAKRSNYGQAFWFFPSTWLALGPLLQLFVPVYFHIFGWDTLPWFTSLAHIDASLWVWTTSSILIAFGCALVEPRRTLSRGLTDLPAWLHSQRQQIRVFLQTAILMLAAAIVARLFVGGISVAELQLTRRVIGEGATSSSRITMLIGPLLTLGTCLLSLRVAVMRLAGLPTFGAIFTFGIALFVAASYNIILGSRGGVLFIVAPSMLIMLLLTEPARRGRFLLAFGGVLVVLLFLADIARYLTLFIASQHNDKTLSPIALLNGYVSLLGDDRLVPKVTRDSNLLVDFIGRIGTGWILTAIMDNPNAFGALNFWSFLRVFSVSFPTSLSPWDSMIPYPTGASIHDLGYLAGEIITGRAGQGTAVPPPAEIYWRFGVLGFPTASLLWGISLGLLFRFWSVVSPVFCLFVCGYFAFPLLLIETSWQIFADIFRHPLMLLAFVNLVQYFRISNRQTA